MTRIVLIAFILTVGLNHITAGQVAVVRDPYKQRQLENMVFMRWGGFKPKWYYFLFHNKYRKGPDRRTLLQLLPTDAVIRLNKEKTEDEADEVVEMYAMQYYDAANRGLELHYHFHYKQIFDALNEEIDQLRNQAIELNTDPKAVQSFTKEQERLNNEIEIIRQGWLEKGDSAEAMKELENDLRALKGNLIKFVKLQNINQKYSAIQP
jgi:excinuclease UvrABC nuclease subunit